MYMPTRPNLLGARGVLEIVVPLDQLVPDRHAEQAIAAPLWRQW
jgi:hypothetical protein